MPERFGRFDMPGLRFWSHCPPAGMGFRLPVGGFCPRNWGPLSLWGHLTIPSDGEGIYFTRSISLNSQLNLLLAALLFFCCSFQPFQYSCCPCSLLPPPPQPGFCWHYFAYGHKLGLCCVPPLPCFEKEKQKLEEYGEGWGRGS